MRRAHDRTPIDPLVHMGDLTFQLIPVGQCERVSNGRSADLDTAQKSVPPNIDQVFVRNVQRKVVTGQFGPDAAVVGRVVNELKQINLIGLGYRLITSMGRILHVLSKRVSGEPQETSRFARSHNFGASRIRGRDESGERDDRSRREHGPGDKLTAIKVGIHVLIGSSPARSNCNPIQPVNVQISGS